jgi:hypothetical protein
MDRTAPWISLASNGTIEPSMTAPGWLTALVLAVVVAVSGSEAGAQVFRPRNGKLTPVLAKAGAAAPAAKAAPVAPAPVPAAAVAPAAKKPVPIAAKATKAPGRRAGTAKKKRKARGDADDVQIKDDDDDGDAKTDE